MEPKLRKIDAPNYGDAFVERVRKAAQERDQFRGEDARYTLVLHSVRRKFNLTNNEYVLADTIHKLSSNHSQVPGWCWASKETLGRSVGVSRQSAHTAIKKLVDKGLVKQHSASPYLCSTRKWFDAVEVVRVARNKRA